MAERIARQIFTIVLPATGVGVEAVADLVEHTSVEFEVWGLQEKTIQILASEVVVAGVPGNLWCWVELSPFDTVTTATYWAAIGGGGGILPPVAPHIEVGLGVNLTPHTIILPWTIHSEWARLVVQTPVAAALPNASWLVQAVFTGASK